MTSDNETQLLLALGTLHNLHVVGSAAGTADY